MATVGGTKTSKKREGCSSVMMVWGISAPPTQKGSSLVSLRPVESQGSQKPKEPGPQLQGHESAGSCPGLTPNHGGRATSVPLGEASPGMGVG